MIKFAGIFAVFLTIIAGYTVNTEAKSLKKTEKKVDINWTQSTKNLHKALVKEGMDSEIAKYLINTCKAKATNPRHCVIYAAAVSKAESNMGKNAQNGNMFGVTGYKGSLKGAINQWVTKYSKYWYKAQSASFFYPPKGKVSKSNYCTDEVSSGSSKGCPNGLLHSTRMVTLLSSVK